MTAATLHIATPTALERTLLRLADRITAFVEHRREVRVERREIALNVLREQQSRRQDPRSLELALLTLGSRPRP